MSVLLVWSVPGAIYSNGCKNSSQHPCIDLHFQFLERYGTKKSNCRTKSYGSGKFVVQQSIHHPSFRDISTILAPILTHEQPLE